MNEANYSAGLLMADVWKNTVDFQVGDIFRIVHHGKKHPNRIHLERIPIQDKVQMVKIYKYSEKPGLNSKYLGNKIIYVDLKQILSIIKNEFQNREFTSLNLTSFLRKYKDFRFEDLEEFKGLYLRKTFLTYYCLNGLVNRGYLTYDRQFYKLLENPKISKALHHNHSLKKEYLKNDM